MLKVKFPNFSILVIKYLIDVAGLNFFSSLTLDKIDEDLVFEVVFSAPEEDSVNMKNMFIETGYESQFLIVNLGTIFFIILVCIFLSFLIFICKPLEARS